MVKEQNMAWPGTCGYCCCISMQKTLMHGVWWWPEHIFYSASVKSERQQQWLQDQRCFVVWFLVFRGYSLLFHEFKPARNTTLKIPQSLLQGTYWVLVRSPLYLMKKFSAVENRIKILGGNELKTLTFLIILSPLPRHNLSDGRSPSALCLPFLEHIESWNS